MYLRGLGKDVLVEFFICVDHSRCGTGISHFSGREVGTRDSGLEALAGAKI